MFSVLTNTTSTQGIKTVLNSLHNQSVSSSPSELSVNVSSGPVPPSGSGLKMTSSGNTICNVKSDGTASAGFRAYVLASPDPQSDSVVFEVRETTVDLVDGLVPFDPSIFTDRGKDFYFRIFNGFKYMATLRDKEDFLIYLYPEVPTFGQTYPADVLKITYFDEQFQSVFQLESHTGVIDASDTPVGTYPFFFELGTFVNGYRGRRLLVYFCSET